ncbi:MAG: host specificity factor TipJ family phage tail protein [Pseudomonadota bacterium]
MDKLSEVIVIHSMNPFNTTERVILNLPDGSELLESVPSHDGAIVCTINGEPVAKENWDCILQSGDIVIFQNLPAGGGGGSNPLQIILSIVLVIAGIVTGNPYLIAAGIGIGALGLITTPKVPIANQSVESPSPTYNVALSGNSARLNQPIPIPYGRHIIYPDFAAQPYTEYSNNDAFYFAILCLGNTSDLTIESISIDDTAISSFEEVQLQIQGSSFTPTQTLVNVAVVNAPEVANQTLESFRTVGPFAAIGPGLTTSRIGIDVVMPKGLYYANEDGSLANKTITWKVEAREIDDLNNPIGDWNSIGSETFTTNKNTPQRRSYSYELPSARYEIRTQRTDIRDDNTRAAHDIEWAGMRAYVDTVSPLETTAAYLAVKIRATSQLSGASQRKISAILIRKLAKWNPTTGWSAPIETKSIAWVLADILRNNIYGGSIPDNRIDLQSLYDLDLLWESRGDVFNGIIDKRLTIWQALTTVARVGRAKPLMRGSVFTFVRDSQQTLPVALFNMRNIKRGSFSIAYSLITEDSPDGVELEYFNELTWSTDTVQVLFPGITEPVNVSKGSILGATKRSQAIRECAYTVASAAYRTSTIKFITEMEGFLPSFGDLIAVSHDVPNWGYSAEVEDVFLPSVFITEDAEWSIGQYYAMLADSEGDVFGPYKIQQGLADREIVFLEEPAIEFYTGTDRERTRISIGMGVAFLKMCRVISINPNATNDIEITAIVEDNRVHEADSIYLPTYATPRPGYFMATDTPNYADASTSQKAAIGAWVSRPDGTVGEQGDSAFYYQ